MLIVSLNRKALSKLLFSMVKALYRSMPFLSYLNNSSRIEKYKHLFQIEKYKYKFKHHGKYISTNGSDKWIIEEVFKHKKGGFFVECGAYTGAKKSNTFLLEKFYKWSGICIESNPAYFKKLKQARNCICLKECIDGEEGEVDFLCYKTTGGIVSDNTDNDHTVVNEKLSVNENNHKIITVKTKTLQQILKENNAPKIMEFLVLDVEGAETRIMRKFPFNEYRFLTMVIEKPTSELENYFIQNGYRIVKKDPERDTFYIHESVSFDVLV
jgi:FkbM family methyltransferase